MKVAYIVSRFPKITETFVLNEMLALEALGAQIELYPLVRQKEAVIHRKAIPFIDRAHYARINSPGVLWSHFYWLIRAPQRYLSLWFEILWSSWKSPDFLLRSAASTLLGAHFARRISSDRIEHIHAHFATHATLAALTVHRLTGIPFSFTAHAHDIFVNRAFLKEKIDEAAFVATISEHNRSFLEEMYGQKAVNKVHIVRCGVDQDFFQAHAPKQDAGAVRIVCIAGLEEKKGHLYLLEACRLLVEQGLNFLCLIIGDGQLKGQLETRIAELDLKERIKLLGQQNHSQVLDQLSQADLMVLPSVRLPSGKQEGIPVALMEAMAMSVPVIATDLSGIPELIEDGKTGCLVPERDPEAIAAAVLKLANNATLRETIGRAGRSKVARDYDLHKNAAQLYHLMGHGIQKVQSVESLPLQPNDAIEGIR